MMVQAPSPPFEARLSVTNRVREELFNSRFVTAAQYRLLKRGSSILP